MMRTETFHTPGETSIRVRVPAGQVEIETVDGEETRVELQSEPEAEAEATIDERGGVVIVEIEERRLLFLRRAPDARVRITCPHSARIVFKGVSTQLSVRGRTGSVEVHTVSGQTEIERVEGDLTLKSVSGQIAVGAVSGRSTVQAVSGSIRFDEAGGPITAKTVSGSQRYGSVAEGAVDLKSVSGSMEVGIRRGSRIWMDVKSLSGKTSSDLPVGDEPVDGDGPLVELRANSTSGSIRITRA